MTTPPLYDFLRESYYHWSDHRASRMGAALSYYTIFAIIPLLSLIILVAGAWLGHAYIQNELFGHIAGVVGSDNAEFVQSMLAAGTHGSTGVIVSVVSVVILVVGTLSLLRELQTSMDDLWDAPKEDERPHWFKTYIRTRAISLSLIPVLVFLLMVSSVFSVILSVAGSGIPFILKIANSGFSLVITTALFAFIYRYLPTRKLPWKEILWGAFGTALLFVAGKYLIGLYLHGFARTSAYGAAGALVVMLVWIYYSVQVFFYGASMTYVWSRRHGHLSEDSVVHSQNNQ